MLARWLNRIWYQGAFGAALLAPLAWIFAVLVAVRRSAYARGWLAAARVSRPVIVVGNLSVGGSGKTPFTLWLALALSARGLRTGIASRGYGGRQRSAALVPATAADPAIYGDEPVMLAAEAGVPVAVARRRADAARCLIEQAGVDCVLLDDGLQHYALQRDLEIVVIDASVGLGNGRLLPAGPLREPLDRLQRVNVLVVNGSGAGAGTGLPIAPPWLQGPAQLLSMRLGVSSVEAVAAASAESRRLEDFAGQTVHALAAIAQPQRFFATLRAAGLNVIEHVAPDHHAWRSAELRFADQLPILMTAKDAVKCRHFAPRNCWQVRVRAEVQGGESLVNQIVALCGR